MVLHARQLYRLVNESGDIVRWVTYIHQTWSRSKVVGLCNGHESTAIHDALALTRIVPGLFSVLFALYRVRLLKSSMTRPTPRIFLIRHGEFIYSSMSNIESPPGETEWSLNG